MPKVAPDTPPRLKQVGFRVDEPTYDLLTQAAAKANQSVAAFAREATLEQLRRRGYVFG